MSISTSAYSKAIEPPPPDAAVVWSIARGVAAIVGVGAGIGLGLSVLAMLAMRLWSGSIGIGDAARLDPLVALRHD